MLIMLTLTIMAAFYGGFIFMIITGRDSEDDVTAMNEEEDQEQKEFLKRWDDKRENRK